MKIKSEKTKLIIWALVALVVGVVIGMLITNATTGNATRTTSNRNTDNLNSIKYHIRCNCENAAGARTGCHYTTSSPTGPDAINGFCRGCCVEGWVDDTYTIS